MEQQVNFEQNKAAVVIITGASSGLGAALTRKLDATLPEDVEFWLIARDESKLAHFAGSLDHQSRLFAIDLTEYSAFVALRTALEEESPHVLLLINNAGEGCSCLFEEQDVDAHASLCDLNVRAQLAMTSVVLPHMSQGSALLFTASVAAFFPQPGFASYAASKAFIVSYSRAIREELKDRGIRVTVTCPNTMFTDFLTEGQKQARLNSYKRFGIEDPDLVAEKTLAAMRRDKAVVVTSLTGKAIRVAAKLLPTGWVVSWINRKNRTGSQ
ncbi:MAG: SDR family NAD(P)-dependent oxidoreductase [Clostridiaceae bacterium]|nr:SDR family NAD(P)-dependent oxidoreductase [Clostridiaceae bacterium]